VICGSACTCGREGNGNGTGGNGTRDGHTGEWKERPGVDEEDRVLISSSVWYGARSRGNCGRGKRARDEEPRRAIHRDIENATRWKKELLAREF